AGRDQRREKDEGSENREHSAQRRGGVDPAEALADRREIGFRASYSMLCGHVLALPQVTSKRIKMMRINVPMPMYMRVLSSPGLVECPETARGKPDSRVTDH